MQLFFCSPTYHKSFSRFEGSRVGGLSPSLSGVLLLSPLLTRVRSRVCVSTRSVVGAHLPYRYWQKLRRIGPHTGSACVPVCCCRRCGTRLTANVCAVRGRRACTVFDERFHHFFFRSVANGTNHSVSPEPEGHQMRIASPQTTPTEQCSQHNKVGEQTQSLPRRLLD